MNNFDELVSRVLSLVKNKMLNSNFNTYELEYCYLYINEDEWKHLFDYLISEGLICSSCSLNTQMKSEFLANLRITSKGVDYLQKNAHVKYPSAKVLLSTITIEYEKEVQRTNTIDMKISTLIALLAFLFPVYIGLLNIELTLENKYHMLYIIFVFLIILFNIIALIFLLIAITTRTYLGINPDEVINDYTVREEEKYNRGISINPIFKCYY